MLVWCVVCVVVLCVLCVVSVMLFLVVLSVLSVDVVDCCVCVRCVLSVLLLSVMLLIVLCDVVFIEWWFVELMEDDEEIDLLFVVVVDVVECVLWLGLKFWLLFMVVMVFGDVKDCIFEIMDEWRVKIKFVL